MLRSIQANIFWDSVAEPEDATSSDEAGEDSIATDYRKQMFCETLWFPLL